MKLSLVVALSQNKVIGLQNRLPWHLPADLQHFKKLTWGKPILMGRKTFEAIGKPLPGRENLILSQDRAYQAPGCTVIHSVEQALEHASAELMIIGGAQIYALFLPLADCIYLTEVMTEVAGDTYFPPINPKEWQVISQEHFPADEKNAYAYCFRVLDRVSLGG